MPYVEGSAELKLKEMSKGVLDNLQVPKIGASIGSKGTTSAGSLGLYVRDRCSNDLCFMTCWHCVSEHRDVFSPAPVDSESLIATATSQCNGEIRRKEMSELRGRSGAVFAERQAIYMSGISLNNEIAREVARDR